MPDEEKTLSWVQTLNKTSLIDELRNRGVEVDESKKIDELRQKLRELIRESIEKKKGEDNKEKVDKSVSKTSDRDVVDTSESDSEMADNVKLEFRLNHSDWETFTEQMEFFFISKDIKDDKKAAHLLVRVDANAFQLIKQLMAPAKVQDKSYADIVKVMSDHLNPKPSELMERCVFHQAKQEKSESVADYVVKLRKLALHCNFKSLDDSLRDQFVCGLKCMDTKTELFKKEKLTFDEAYKEAVAQEGAQKNANKSLNTLTLNSSTADDVLAIRSDNKNNHKGNQVNTKSGAKKDFSQVTCYCCGRQGHTKTICNFKEATCHSCNKKGHLRAVCRNKEASRQKKQERVQHLQKEDYGVAAEDDDQSSVHTNNQDDFYCIQSEIESDLCKKAEQKCISDYEGAPMYENIYVNGIKVRMEIDTGTYVTVLSENIYNKYFKNFQIVKTDRKLRAYDEKALVPLGKLTNLTVMFKNQTRILECFVLPGSGPALMGRQWLSAFKLWPLKIVNSNKDNVHKLDTVNLKKILSDKYQKLFSSKPGLYNKSKSKIYLKENVKPIALKYRQVAHALLPLIEDEIKRLVGLGHLEPVDISEWATPIVPIFKSNGNIRICGDFKVTLNKHIIMDKYPLHTIDDIFTKLQGGNSFSELDMTHCYMQFPVDEESSKLLTIVTHKGLYRYKKIPEGVSPAPTDVQKKWMNV